MKTNLCAAASCLFVMHASAVVLFGQGVIHSHPATNGVYAEIAMETTTAKLASSEIHYCLLTTNKNGAKIAYPKAEYLCRMELLDARGSNVPPRVAAQKIGNRFDDLRAFSYDVLEIVGRRGSNPAHPRIEPIFSGSCAAKQLPAPDHLFEIDGAGEYILRLRFQVFEQTRSSTNFVYHLTLLPSMDVPVIKR